MVKILNSFPENMAKRDAYKLTRAQSTLKMQEAAGEVLTPSAWVLYETTDAKTGETKTVLVIESNGVIYGTISNTFIREFSNAAEEFNNDVGAIRVIEGNTKAGRTYITCELA